MQDLRRVAPVLPLNVSLRVIVSFFRVLGPLKPISNPVCVLIQYVYVV
jgi:hypothetical protein